MQVFALCSAGGCRLHSHIFPLLKVSLCIISLLPDHIYVLDQYFCRDGVLQTIMGFATDLQEGPTLLLWVRLLNGSYSIQPPQTWNGYRQAVDEYFSKLGDYWESSGHQVEPTISNSSDQNTLISKTCCPKTSNPDVQHIRRIWLMPWKTLPYIGRASDCQSTRARHASGWFRSLMLQNPPNRSRVLPHFEYVVCSFYVMT